MTDNHADFFNDDSGDVFSEHIDSLNMDGISGITCKIVHPIVDDTVEKFFDLGDTSVLKDMLSPMEAQVGKCLSTEQVLQLKQALEDDPDDLDGICVVRIAGHVQDDGPVEDDRLLLAFEPADLANFLDLFSALLRVSDRAVAHKLGLDDEWAQFPSGFAIMWAAFQAVVAALVEQKPGDFEAAIDQMQALATQYRHVLAQYGISPADYGDQGEQWADNGFGFGIRDGGMDADDFGPGTMDDDLFDDDFGFGPIDDDIDYDDYPPLDF